MKRAEKREHLVAVAADLFSRHGYRAVGVDLVIAEAGVAKTTLYRHFRTKEDLIVAVLRRLDERYRDGMRAAVAKAGADARRQLLATFDYLERWFGDEAFHGCPFASAAGEYSDRKNPVFQETVMHQRLLTAYFEELARAAQLAEPKRVAEQVNLLHEGATSMAHVSGDPGVARRAKAIAAQLIYEAGTPS